jgi:pyruvate dehydrogenase E2 component (dihydrolipoamide acetyltransferase)
MAETINMPKLGFDMAEGTLVRWLKKEGETVTKGEVLAEIETDKATVEVESSASGVVRRLLVDEGAVVPVNTPIAIIGAAEEQLPVVSGQSSVSSDQLSVVERSGEPEKQKSEPVAQSTISNPQSTILRASPLAKKMARARGLDLSQVRGTGPGGRIVRRDVEAVIGEQKGESREQRVEESVPLTKLRQIIARRMTEAKASVPHFYVTHEFKMDALLALRTQLNGYLPEEEKISVNDFIVRAAALTLRQFPNLNASFAGDKVARHGAVNIGVAVAVEGGLLTVVCKDADQKPLRQIAAEVKRMAAAAREGKVRPEDIEGSTFSISNLGMFDVENFAAIINPPESAILAVGSARQVPVVEAGEVKIGWRMKATLSVDHRVSDGAEAARFMQALAVYLEEPLRLLV